MAVAARLMKLARRDRPPDGRSPCARGHQSTISLDGRLPNGKHRTLVVLCLVWCVTTLGCGTTKWSDTPRTATEQLLISDAVDRAVSDIDFSALSGRAVFFDSTYLKGSVDENYVVSSLRQHLLASGSLLMETRELADYVIEARSGAIGTDRSDLLFGVPSVNVPTVPGMPMAMPSSIPEIPLAKTTNQKAVAKLAVFAYNRKTGRPVLQSGIDPAISMARNSWLFGAGPFRRGTIYDHHHELNNGVDIPIIGGRERSEEYSSETLPVTAQAVFPEPAAEHSTPEAKPSDGQVATQPAAAGNQMARLPAVDRSLINAQPQSPANGAPATGVQRAQYTEPARRASIGVSSTSDKKTGSQGGASSGGWGWLSPTNWFGGADR